MKNKLYSTCLLILTAAVLYFLPGCKKDGPQYGQLGLTMVSKIDTNVVSAENTLYPDHNGRYMSISDARFYVSDVSVQNSNGSWYAVPNSLLLKIYENQNYDITSTVPAGTYTAIKFYVGLDSTINAINPATDSSAKNVDSVLSSTLEPNMYFGAGQGYKFFYFSGSVLPSGAHLPVPVNYQVGGSANLQLVTLTNNFSIQSGKVHYLNIVCDYGKLLEGFSIASGNNDIGNSYGSGGQVTTATMVADSIPNIFSVGN